MPRVYIYIYIYIFIYIYIYIHRTHAKCDNSILVDTHYKSAGHDFTKHARVTIIEKLENTNVCVCVCVSLMTGGTIYPAASTNMCIEICIYFLWPSVPLEYACKRIFNWYSTSWDLSKCHQIWYAYLAITRFHQVTRPPHVYFL